jgi:hypothetical protein
MANDRQRRQRRLGDALLIAVLVVIVALFVYSMIDAYVLSISERPFANPFEGPA